MSLTPRWMLAAGLLLLALFTAGCATVAPSAVAPGGAGAPAVTSNPVDPWENWNRKVYAFNDVIDNAVLKPVATTYRQVVPSLVRTGIGNVFGNIGDVWSAANHLLQGKVQQSLEMSMRVLTNTVFGLGGLLDPASEMGLTRRSEDFGQTLGRWGLGNGPFLVLPLLGPSTVRDATGFVLDRQASASRLPDTTAGSVALTSLELINTRSELLATTKLLDQIALDKYGFVRDAYLARRRDALYDGAAPMETFDDEPADGAAAAPAGAASAAQPASKTAPKIPAKPALKTAP